MSHTNRQKAQKLHVERVESEIRFLDTALRNAYGCDYSFTIMGQGKIIGASSMVYGRIIPAPAEHQEMFDATPETTASANEAFNGERS